MAAAAVASTTGPQDPKAVLADAYSRARRIGYARWRRQIEPAEIDGLVNSAVIALLNAVDHGRGQIFDVPRTTKYLTNYVDWRAKDHLRDQRRRPAQAPLPAERAATGAGFQGGVAVELTPEEVLETSQVRDLVDELQTRIASPVNRLIVHLFFFQRLSCREIAEAIQRLLGVELTVKAVERRKAEATKGLTREWDRALSGAHCRELASGGDHGAVTRYALGVLDLDDERDKRLHDIVVAHLKHCARCRAVAVAARRDMRQLALLAAPVLIEISNSGTTTAEHTIAHGPAVFERALETVRSGLGRATIRAAETIPNDAGRAGEMVTSASAGSGAALGGPGRQTPHRRNHRGVRLRRPTAVRRTLRLPPNPAPPPAAHASAATPVPALTPDRAGGQGRAGPAPGRSHRGPTGRPPRPRGRRPPGTATRQRSPIAVDVDGLGLDAGVVELGPAGVVELGLTAGEGRRVERVERSDLQPHRADDLTLELPR